MTEREYPIQIFLDYLDNVSVVHEIRWGFYFGAGSCGNPVVNPNEQFLTVGIPQNSWVHFASQDVKTLAPDMATITRIVVAGNGWDYVGRADNIALLLTPATVQVSIDIRPGSDPNCFNNDGHGVIPVAILGSADLDVTQIDAGTVQLEGLGVRAVGKSNKLLAVIEDVNGDGFDDLVVKIEDTDGTFTSGSDTATLTGSLLDGTPIEGTDAICIVP